VRLAFLILAHDQPDHLARLVSALDHPESDFYVHIDAKFDLVPFQALLGGRKNVHFILKRVSVQWMGFSQVEAVFRLLIECLTKSFRYCVLLSGSDYPIKSNRDIRAFYETADEEYLTFWRLADRPSWSHKIQFHYPIDRIPIAAWSKNKDPVYLRRLFWGRFHKYRHLMPRRRFPFALTPYGGSQWWSLTEGCVRHIVDFVAANPAYSRFYRTTHSPDEMFFHTIVLNSPWANRVRNFCKYEAWSAGTSDEDKRAEDRMLPEDSFNLRYIDWSGARTGERETPAILDDRDWDKLSASADLFARKFDPRRSASVLDRIDREILGTSPVTV
jgi:hypothetical protein